MPSYSTRHPYPAAPRGLARPLLAALLLLAPVAAARGAGTAVPAPGFTPGDSWTYENAKETRGQRKATHDTMTLTRVEDRLLSVEVRPAGSEQPGRELLVNPDWSRTRSVDGRLIVVNRPLAFPLSPGKSWTIEFTETTPADRRHTKEKIEVTYKVAGWEEVSVPAGTFRALRIEGDGTWTIELPPNTLTQAGRNADGNFAITSKQPGRLFSGRLLKTFWYVPEVHRWVRSEEDTYDNNGVRTGQETAVLEAFKVAEGSVASAAEEEPAPKRTKPHRAASKAAKPAGNSAAKPEAKPETPAAPSRPLLQELRLSSPPPSRSGPEGF